MVFNLARFIGPMLAGLVIVWSGVAAAFAANALSYVAFLIALAYLRVETVSATPRRQKASKQMFGKVSATLRPIRRLRLCSCC